MCRYRLGHCAAAKRSAEAVIHSCPLAQMGTRNGRKVLTCFDRQRIITRLRSKPARVGCHWQDLIGRLTLRLTSQPRPTIARSTVSRCRSGPRVQQPLFPAGSPRNISLAQPFTRYASPAFARRVQEFAPPRPTLRGQRSGRSAAASVPIAMGTGDYCLRRPAHDACSDSRLAAPQPSWRASHELRHTRL